MPRLWSLKVYKKRYYVIYKLGFKRDNWFLIVQCFFWGVLSLALVERYPLGSKLALPWDH